MFYLSTHAWEEIVMQDMPVTVRMNTVILGMYGAAKYRCGLVSIRCIKGL